MIEHDFTSRMPKDLTFRLYVLSCQHFGNAAFYRPAVRRAIKMIQEDRRGFWCNLGDATESIHVKDKRYKEEIHAGKYATANAQAEDFALEFSPIANKCLFLLQGNHEETIEDIVRVDELIVDKLKHKYGAKKEILFGGRTIKAKFGDKFRLWATHGSRSVNSQAGDARQREVNDSIRIKRLMRDLQGDCNVMVMGHIHKVRICPPVKQLYMVGDGEWRAIYPDNIVSPEGAIAHDCRWYASTGSFLRTMVHGITTYSEKAMYSPTEIGFLKITVSKGVALDVQKVII